MQQSLCLILRTSCALFFRELVPCCQFQSSRERLAAHKQQLGEVYAWRVPTDDRDHETTDYETATAREDFQTRFGTMWPWRNFFLTARAPTESYHLTLPGALPNRVRPAPWRQQ